MKEIRIRKGKHLSDLDHNIDHEATVHNMVMFITDGCRGRIRFRKEFIAIFNANYTTSTGGYKGRNPTPRITISSDLLNSFEKRVYSESVESNKREKIGRFYGEHQYITRAVIAHNLAHCLIDTPYLYINRRSDKNVSVHGHQWRVIYRALREEFVNPYVEPVPYNWKVDLLDRKSVEVPKKLTGILNCVDCGEKYVPVHCRYGEPHKNDDGRCMGCHVEMNHGLIPDPEVNQNQCGNKVGYPIDDIEYFPRICDRFYYGF